MDIITSGIIEESKKRQTSIVIHRFTLAHAAVAGLLAQTEIGDEAILTGLTIAMETIIASIYGQKWTTKIFTDVAAICVAEVVGLRGAALFVKWVPGAGNAANALSSAVTTELVGWSTYALMSSGLSAENLSEQQKKELYEFAKKTSKEENKTGKELYKKMSKDDKNTIDALIKQITKASKRNDDVVMESLSEEFAKIIMKY